MRETCSRSNLRSSTRVLPKVGLSFRAIRCSVRDVTMMSSMCVAGMRETDPTDAVFQETTAGDLVRSQLLGDSRYRTGCPPPSHRTSLEPESEREFPMQRLSDKIGPFGRCSQPETTPIRDFGAHVAPEPSSGSRRRRCEGRASKETGACHLAGWNECSLERLFFR
jgi:hypothetical protein